MKKKKILYFLDFPYCIGGANKVLLTQAYIMSLRGYKVKVIIPCDEKGEYSTEFDAICSSMKLETEKAQFTVATSPELIDILHSIKDYDIVKKIVEKYNPDLIHSVQINVSVELVSRELRIPHLMNVYQVDRHAFDIPWYNVLPGYHSADSFYFCKRWSDGLRITSSCIRVAHPSVLEEKHRKIKRCEVSIISVGNICERKNQMEIIRFIQKCVREGMVVKLTLLGYDESIYAQRCKEYVKQNGLEHFITFKGFVSNVSEYYRNADLLIMASTIESYPGVIVESMAYGVPVLVTQVAGVPELVIDEYNGFSIQGYDGQAIYDGFNKYRKACEDDRICTVIDNAYKTFEDNHTYSRVGEELEKYYEQIISNKSTEWSQLVQIEEVRRVFEQYVKGKCVNEKVLPLVWWFFHLNKRICNKKVAIWGAGYLGNITLDASILLEDIEIVGFIDIHKKGQYGNLPIFNDIQEALKIVNVVLIAVYDTKARSEIAGILESYGMMRNRDYYFMFNDTLEI